MSQLYAITTDIWGAESTTAVGLGITFPNRMTVVQLASGGLMLHSPIPIDAALAGALAELGPVELIIAPNLFHHLYVPAAAARYPDARVLGATGFAKKRPDIEWDGFLDDEPVPELSGSLERFRHRGTVARENVFFHAASRSLIVTDLVFNIRETENFASRLFFGLIGVRGRVKQSPAFKYVATKDREAAGRGLRELLALDWERLIPSHGPVVESDAKAQFAEGARWMLEGAPALSE